MRLPPRIKILGLDLLPSEVSPKGLDVGPGQGQHLNRARSGKICLALQGPVDDAGLDPDDSSSFLLPRRTPERVPEGF